MNAAEAAGRALAERHVEETEADPSISLLNFAESARTDDWTLRSALVRFAQLEPTRAGAVLELVRRSSAALHGATSTIERHTVSCSRTLTLDDLLPDGEAATAAADRYADGRITDVARICADDPSSPETADFLRGYRSVLELEAEEEATLALLPAVLHLDRLGDVLAAWALTAQDAPPIDAVDATCGLVFTLLDDLDVPRETAPPGRGRPTR